jgi:hypothetical protein
VPVAVAEGEGPGPTPLDDARLLAIGLLHAGRTIDPAGA